MVIQSVTLDNIYPFTKPMVFNFSAGINVLIGQDAVGKSHVLKILYAVILALGRATHTDDIVPLLNRYLSYHHRYAHGLMKDRKQDASIILHGDFGMVTLVIDAGTGFIRVDCPLPLRGCSMPVFIPDRHIMSLLTKIPEQQQILRDILPLDPIADDLIAHLMKPDRFEEGAFSPVHLQEFVQHLHGSFTIADDGYGLLKPDGTFLPLHLLASGTQRFLMLQLLFQKGVLHADTPLFWDSPETELSPRLLNVLIAILTDMVRGGLQFFITSHHYLLCTELSLLLEARKIPTDRLRFFCLYRDDADAIALESESLFDGLRHNPILDEFVAHYNRQHALFMAEDMDS